MGTGSIEIQTCFRTQPLQPYKTGEKRIIHVFDDKVGITSIKGRSALSYSADVMKGGASVSQAAFYRGWGDRYFSRRFSCENVGGKTIGDSHAHVYAMYSTSNIEHLPLRVWSV